MLEPSSAQTQIKYHICANVATLNPQEPDDAAGSELQSVHAQLQLLLKQSNPCYLIVWVQQKSIGPATLAFAL